MPLTSQDAKLIEAVKSKNISEIRLMLESKDEKQVKANINCQQSPDYNTPLHLAIQGGDLATVNELLKHGAKTYITNKEFKTPTRLAAEKEFKNIEDKKNIISALLENHSSIDGNYLDGFIDFCLQYYRGDGKLSVNDGPMLDHAVSRLVGDKVAGFIDNGEKWARLMTHLKEIKLSIVEEKKEEKKGQKKDVEKPESLEGWHQHEFLPLRIRALFEMVVRVRKELIVVSDLPKIETSVDPRQTVFHRLRHELLIELETLRVRQLINTIALFNDQNTKGEKKEKKKEKKKVHPIMLEKLSQNVFRQMKCVCQSQEYEYAMPGGWDYHSIYMSCIVAEDKKLLFRIDNLGFDVERHEYTNIHGNKEYYPHVIDEEYNEKNCLDYIKNLLRIKAGERTDDANASREIYKGGTSKSSAHKRFNYPHSRPQSLGTCVVTSHNIGLRIRLKTAEFYSWVLNEELRIHTVRTKQSEIRQDNFWNDYFKPRRLPRQISHKLIEHYKSQTKIYLLLDDPKLPRELSIDSYFVELSIIKEENNKIIADEKLEPQDGQDRRRKLLKYSDNWYGQRDGLKLPDLLKLSEAQKKPILILGHAGMGKSTLCQNITYQWARDASLQKQFAWVFCIRLRHLNHVRYPSTTRAYTVADIVRKECCPQGLFPAWTQDWLDKTLKQKNILWLLDGLDELPYPEPLQLVAALNSIRKKQHVVITSRPQAAHRVNTQLRLEITGFTPDNVGAYIENFSKALPHSDSKEDKKRVLAAKPVEEKKTEASSFKPAELVKFLDGNPTIKGIARIPINLELICSIWRLNPGRLAAIDTLTMTELYNAITLWLFRRFLQRNGYDLKELDNEKRLLRRLSEEVGALEKIAFEMMIHDKFMITGGVFEKTIPAINDDKGLRDDILNINIFKTISHAAIGEESNYHFIHFTFQEFLAARYLVSSLQKEPSTEQYKQAITFIRREKYSDFYRLVFEFSAGLLSLPDVEKKRRSEFWRALQDSPCDLTGGRHTRLLIGCLQQTSCIEEIATNNPNIMFFLQEFLPSALRGKEHKEEKYSLPNTRVKADALLHAIQTSPKVVTYLEEKQQNFLLKLTLSDDQSGAEVGQGLISHADKASQMIIVDRFKEILFIYENRSIPNPASLYAAKVLQKHLDIKEILVNAIKSNNPRHKIRALWLIGVLKLNSDSIIDVLIHVMSQDKIEQMRVYAIAALEKMGDYSDKILAGLQQVVKEDSNEKVKKIASEVLSQLEESQDYYDNYLYDHDAYDDPDEDPYEDLTPAERWLVEDFPRRIPSIIWDEADDDGTPKESNQAEVVGEIKGHSYRVYEDEYQEYLLRKLDEESASIRQLYILDDKAFRILLNKDLYLLSTDIDKLIHVFVHKKNYLLGKLIALRALKHEISIAITNNCILVYNQTVSPLCISIADKTDKLDILHAFINIFIDQSIDHGLPLSMYKNYLQMLERYSEDAQIGLQVSDQTVHGIVDGFQLLPKPQNEIDVPSVSGDFIPGHVDVDVSSDNRCWFWSIGLSWLVQAIAEAKAKNQTAAQPPHTYPAAFATAYGQLFGITGDVTFRPSVRSGAEAKGEKWEISDPKTIEAIYKMLLDYDGKKDTPNQFEGGILSQLICEVFRANLVRFMQSAPANEKLNAVLHRARASYSQEGGWDKHLKEMLDSDAWGGTAESAGVACMLNTEVRVYHERLDRNGADEKEIYPPDRPDRGPAKSICIIHAYGSDQSEQRGHYRMAPRREHAYWLAPAPRSVSGMSPSFGESKTALGRSTAELIVAQRKRDNLSATNSTPSDSDAQKADKSKGFIKPGLSLL